MIGRALAGKPLPVYGDGSNIRDWIYVEDHAAAIDAVLSRGRLGEVYNVGACHEVDNLTLVRLICRTLDALRPKASGSYAGQIRFVTDRPGHDRRYALTAEKSAGSSAGERRRILLRPLRPPSPGTLRARAGLRPSD